MRRFRRIVIGVCVAAAIGGGLWLWLSLRAAQDGIRTKREAIRASGAPRTFADAAPPPVPDDENAAVAIEEALGIFEAADAAMREREEEEGDRNEESALIFEFQSEEDPWLEDPEIDEVVARWLARREQAGLLLQQALSRPQCRFGSAWVSMLASIIPREVEASPASDAASQPTPAPSSAGALTAGGKWFWMTAAFAARQGDAPGAYRAIEDGLRLLQLSTQDHPSFVMLLIRGSHQQRLLRLLERVAGRLPMPPGVPARLAALMGRLEDPGGLGRTFVNERAQGMDVFRHLSEAVPEKDRWMPDFLWRFEENRYLGLAERAIALAGRPYAEARADWAAFSDEVEASPPRRVFSRMLTFFFPRVAVAEAGRLTALRLARAALALEASRGEDGALPEEACGRVTEIDPCSGRPLLCRPEPDGGVLLYSVGRDGEDDGGQGESMRWRRDSDTLWRIGGRVPRHP